MAEEIEAKWLDIDSEKIEAKLKKLGAKKQFDQLYRVRIFDYPGFTLNARAAWVRLRDEGDRVVLSYKERITDNPTDKSGRGNDKGMIEHEITVSDFDQTVELLHALGMIDKFTEEKRRIRYLYQDIEFDIDFMPALKPFLEIEAKSWEDVDKGAKLLGLDIKDKKVFSAFQIYALSGIDMMEYQELRFDGLVKRVMEKEQK